MGVPDIISYFDDFEGANEWSALSNFHQGAPLHFGPYVFPTGEHMFQALKATTKRELQLVLSRPTPAEAKAQGKRLLRLRPDWERVKYDVMRLVLWCKFRPGREEHGVLLATGDALLVEGTTWGDRVWGVDLKAGRKEWERRKPELVGDTWDRGEGWLHAPGRNWLGTLLMARRAELYAEAGFPGCMDAMYDEMAQFIRWQPVEPDKS